MENWQACLRLAAGLDGNRWKDFPVSCVVVEPGERQVLQRDESFDAADSVSESEDAHVQAAPSETDSEASGCSSAPNAGAESSPKRARREVEPAVSLYELLDDDD